MGCQCVQIAVLPGVHRRELFSIYGMRNELQRHCLILKVSLIDGMINDRTLESMAMDRVLECRQSRLEPWTMPGECIDLGTWIKIRAGR